MLGKLSLRVVSRAKRLRPGRKALAGTPARSFARESRRLHYSESILRRLLLDDGPPLAGATACYSDYYSDDAFGGSD
jgi:hypothetical protein